MRQVKDQMGRTVSVPDFPKRIISLVPSQTELLHDLGLEGEVVGITKFCVHPKSWRKDKTIVGGTKQVHFDTIKQLEPDLIIGNKEENEEGFITQLANEYPVWMSDIANLEDALDMIEMIGEVTNTSQKAEAIVVDVLSGFQDIESHESKVSAVYLIWNDPIMAVGHDTFINDMLRQAGFRNLVEGERYPEVSLEKLKELKPKKLLLSSEPFPFKGKHVEYFSMLLPGTEVLIVDGEMFSWYGSRLVKAAEYLNSL